MSTPIRDNARILRHACGSAMVDLRATYTWRSWTFAWLVRILCQVTMFALIGELIGVPATVEYLVVGNAVFITADVVMLVCASTSWERISGTLPLLIAAPAAPFVVFAGRSVQWIIDGLVCSTVALLLLGPVLGAGYPLPAFLLVVPLIAVIGVSVYAFGLVLGGLALRAMRARNLIGRLGSLGLMVTTGVQVPVDFWPAPVAGAARFLPLTHGLQAIRDLLAGAPSGDVVMDVFLEILVGAGWAVIAAVVFWRLVWTGRRDGSIEFGG